MKKMVADFMKANPKIKITANTVEWAQYYQRMPAAVTAGKGPDVGVMHLDQLATNAARKAIVPVDDLAKSIGLAESDFTPEVWQAGHLQGRPLRHPAGRALAGACTTTPSTSKKAGIAAAPDRRGVVHRRPRQAEVLRPARSPFWMPNRWPAHLMFLSLLWQNGGEPVRRRRQQGDVRLRGRRRARYLDGRAPSARLQPHQRRPGLPVRRVQERQDVGHVGRHLADQRPQGGQGAVRHRADPHDRQDQGGLGELAQLLHHQARRARTTTSCRRPRCSSTG